MTENREQLPRHFECRSFYFGCWLDAGHYFFNRSMRTERDAHRAVPWGYGVEKLMPKAQVQGEAALHHKTGWTALSFADRSVDSRGNSHSTFVFEDILDFEDALAAAREHYPRVFQRFTFEVTPAEVGHAA